MGRGFDDVIKGQEPSTHFATDVHGNIDNAGDNDYDDDWIRRHNSSLHRFTVGHVADARTKIRFIDDIRRRPSTRNTHGVNCDANVDARGGSSSNTFRPSSHHSSLFNIHAFHDSCNEEMRLVNSGARTVKATMK